MKISLERVGAKLFVNYNDKELDGFGIMSIPDIISVYAHVYSQVRVSIKLSNIENKEFNFHNNKEANDFIKNLDKLTKDYYKEKHKNRKVMI